MRYVVSVAVVTKMNFSMEVATEVEKANAIKPVMKVPAEFICNGSEVIRMTSTMEVASKIKSMI